MIKWIKSGKKLRNTHDRLMGLDHIDSKHLLKVTDPVSVIFKMFSTVDSVG